MKRNYTKPPLTFEAQIDQLESRGLAFGDKGKARHLLSNIGYYRLSGYWHVFLKEPKSDQLFKEGASFERAFRLYCFDRELRLFLMREIEKIEVSFRTQLIFEMSHELRSGFWYLDSNIFWDKEKHKESIDQFAKIFYKSKEVFAKSFKNNYNDPLPPSWILFELLSFGMISRLYSDLNLGEPKRRIAEFYGVEKRVFESWLEMLVYVRNVCAHHSRLWNNRLQVSPLVPNPKKVVAFKDFASKSGNAPVYIAIAIIYFLMKKINPRNSIKSRLIELLSNYPEIDLDAMGFPSNWVESDFWK
jgi:abortive infection bacteriophage resistance protein